jgi:hypothetical protein
MKKKLAACKTVFDLEALFQTLALSDIKRLVSVLSAAEEFTELTLRDHFIVGAAVAHCQRREESEAYHKKQQEATFVTPIAKRQSDEQQFITPQ